MQQKTDSHQGKDLPVARQQLFQQFRMESRKYLPDHGDRSLERGITEENPAEAHKMEGYYHRKEFPDTPAAILLGTPQQTTEELMQSREY